MRNAMFCALLICTVARADDAPITPTEKELAALADIKAKGRAALVEKMNGKPVKITGTLSHRGGYVGQFPQDVFTLSVGQSRVRVYWSEKISADDVEAMRKRFGEKTGTVTILATLEVKEGGKPVSATVSLRGATIKK